MGKKPRKVTQKRIRRRRLRRSSRWWWGLGLAGVALFATLVLLARGGGRLALEVGEEVPLEGAEHIPIDTQPEYRTRPPASGPHYARSLQPGFYEEVVLKEVPYPEGYLVHNLEHGYVIFWYDCSQLTDDACDELKALIQSVMSERPGAKLIAFPYPGLEAPVVLTSWGRRMALPNPNAEDMRAFVAANYNRAPEPGAP